MNSRKRIALRHAAGLLIAGSLLAAAGSAEAVFLETRLFNPPLNVTEAVQSTTVAGPVDISGQIVVPVGTITYENSADHGEIRIRAEHFKATNSCIQDVTRRHIGTMEFSDLLLTCPDSTRVNAKLNLNFEGFAAFTGPNHIGTAHVDVVVTLAGISRFVGRWIPKSSFSSDVCTGIFAGLQTDTLSGIYTTTAFRVPVGQPLTLRVVVSADVSAGACNRPGGDRSIIDFGSSNRRGGFPIGTPVFQVPAACAVQSASARITNNLWSPEPPNVEGTCIAGGPYAGQIGEPIAFDASSSFDSDGQIVSYAWDFGDGTTGNGSPATHAYAVPGVYPVGLCVTDDDGATVCCQSEVTINAPPASVPGGPYIAQIGEMIAFDASSSSDPDGQIVSYVWDFGDGTTGNGSSAEHAYSVPGVYTVGLCVTDDDGASACGQSEATANALPVERLVFDIRPASCPNPLNPKAKGVLPAAILAAAGLDVSQIVPASIRVLGTVAPLRWSSEDVAAPMAGGEGCACSALGGDGLADLTLKFDLPAVVAAMDPATLVKGARVPITITGAMRDGTAFEASDCVEIVQDGNASGGNSPGPRGKYELSGPDSNPVRGSTNIRFSLAAEEPVSLTVYDVSGRVVARLLDGPSARGDHAVQWDAAGLPSGVYFLRIDIAGEGETRKVILAK